MFFISRVLPPDEYEVCDTNDWVAEVYDYSTLCNIIKNANVKVVHEDIQNVIVRFLYMYSHILSEIGASNMDDVLSYLRGTGDLRYLRSEVGSDSLELIHDLKNVYDMLIKSWTDLDVVNLARSSFLNDYLRFYTLCNSFKKEEALKCAEEFSRKYHIRHYLLVNN